MLMGVVVNCRPFGESSLLICNVRPSSVRENCVCPGAVLLFIKSDGEEVHEGLVSAVISIGCVMDGSVDTIDTCSYSNIEATRLNITPANHRLLDRSTARNRAVRARSRSIPSGLYKSSA